MNIGVGLTEGVVSIVFDLLATSISFRRDPGECP
jgi:hypothetical protein